MKWPVRSNAEEVTLLTEVLLDRDIDIYIEVLRYLVALEALPLLSPCARYLKES